MGLFSNWKPGTIAGKILKGAVIGVGGAAALASGVGAIAGAVGGAGLLAGAAGGVGSVIKAVGGGTKTVLSKVSASAAKLITGESKEERQILREVKADAKAAQNKAEFVQKLMKAGLSEKEARIKAGLPADSGPSLVYEEKTVSELLPEEAAEKIALDRPGKINPGVIYAGLGLAALFLLPKILKR